jgi:hypothetical protein
MRRDRGASQRDGFCDGRSSRHGRLPQCARLDGSAPITCGRAAFRCMRPGNRRMAPHLMASARELARARVPGGPPRLDERFSAARERMPPRPDGIVDRARAQRGRPDGRARISRSSLGEAGFRRLRTARVSARHRREAPSPGSTCRSCRGPVPRSRRDPAPPPPRAQIGMTTSTARAARSRSGTRAAPRGDASGTPRRSRRAAPTPRGARGGRHVNGTHTAAHPGRSRAHEREDIRRSHRRRDRVEPPGERDGRGAAHRARQRTVRPARTATGAPGTDITENAGRAPDRTPRAGRARAPAPVPQPFCARGVEVSPRRKVYRRRDRRLIVRDARGIRGASVRFEIGRATS